LYPAAAAVMAAVVMSACALPSQTARATIVKPSVPAHVLRGDWVQERYHAYRLRLEQFRESLAVAVKVAAPELRPRLEPSAPVRHGYGVLPKIVPDTAPPTGPQRATSVEYSWPRTDRMIARELEDLARSETELERGAALPPAKRNRFYEKTADGYLARRERAENIDAHIKHNRFWQATIAADRSRYDSETKLHDAVLERQAVKDKLNTLDVLNGAGDAAPKEELSGIKAVDDPLGRAELKAAFKEREEKLTRIIRDATDRVRVSPFFRVEHPESHLWIFRVFFYTDIDDGDFVGSIKDAIEKIWRHRDGDDEFRVEVAISIVSAAALYREGSMPETAGDIDIGRHLLLFPPDGAVLTTGALATHVLGRGIILGPHDISPHILAHELGHILGFRDLYFRGYKDLGVDGLQVMEVMAEPDDIMGNPGTGRIMRRHFERMIESAGVPEQ
jgi:hypothetical protein